MKQETAFEKTSNILLTVATVGISVVAWFLRELVTEPKEVHECKDSSLDQEHINREFEWQVTHEDMHRHHEQHFGS